MGEVNGAAAVGKAAQNGGVAMDKAAQYNVAAMDESFRDGAEVHQKHAQEYTAIEDLYLYRAAARAGPQRLDEPWQWMAKYILSVEWIREQPSFDERRLTANALRHRFFYLWRELSIEKDGIVAVLEELDARDEARRAARQKVQDNPETESDTDQDGDGFNIATVRSRYSPEELRAKAHGVPLLLDFDEFASDEELDLNLYLFHEILSRRYREATDIEIDRFNDLLQSLSESPRQSLDGSDHEEAQEPGVQEAQTKTPPVSVEEVKAAQPSQKPMDPAVAVAVKQTPVLPPPIPGSQQQQQRPPAVPTTSAAAVPAPSAPAAPTALAAPTASTASTAPSALSAPVSSGAAAHAAAAIPSLTGPAPQTAPLQAVVSAAVHAPPAVSARGQAIQGPPASVTTSPIVSTMGTAASKPAVVSVPGQHGTPPATSPTLPREGAPGAGQGTKPPPKPPPKSKKQTPAMKGMEGAPKSIQQVMRPPQGPPNAHPSSQPLPMGLGAGPQPVRGITQMQTGQQQPTSMGGLNWQRPMVAAPTGMQPDHVMHPPVLAAPAGHGMARSYPGITHQQQQPSHGPITAATSMVHPQSPLQQPQQPMPMAHHDRAPHQATGVTSPLIPLQGPQHVPHGAHGLGSPGMAGVPPRLQPPPQSQHQPQFRVMPGPGQTQAQAQAQAPAQAQTPTAGFMPRSPRFQKLPQAQAALSRTPRPGLAPAPGGPVTPARHTNVLVHRTGSFTSWKPTTTPATPRPMDQGRIDSLSAGPPHEALPPTGPEGVLANTQAKAVPVPPTLADQPSVAPGPTRTALDGASVGKAGRVQGKGLPQPVDSGGSADVVKGFKKQANDNLADVEMKDEPISEPMAEDLAVGDQKPSKLFQSRAQEGDSQSRRAREAAEQPDELQQPEGHTPLAGVIKQDVSTPRPIDEIAGPLADDTTATTPTTTGTAPRALSKARSLKRKRPGSAEGDHPHGPPTHVLWTRGFIKVCASVLDQISSHRDAGMFARSISERDAPGYRNVVRFPTNINSIRAAIKSGDKAAREAAANLPDGDPGTPSVRLPMHESLVPPKGIINSSQLKRDMQLMFANAIMYNPDPQRGAPERLTTKPSLWPSNAVGRAAGDVGGGGGSGEETANKYAIDEDGVVNSTRSMSCEVEKLLDNLRSAEVSAGAAMRDPSRDHSRDYHGRGDHHGSTTTTGSTRSRVTGATPVEDDDADELATGLGDQSFAAATTSTKRRRVVARV